MTYWMVSWSEILLVGKFCCAPHTETSKRLAEQHEIRNRKLRSVAMSDLCKDLRDSTVLQEMITDLPTLVDKYETELTRVLDIHAPGKKRTITVRPAAAWYNGDIDREKRKDGNKMIEKAILYQLTNYLRDIDFEESLQSSYKTFHDTETALVKVHNDIVSAIDNHSYIILLLLDPSAAFDTVDHKILLQRLSCRFGINGKALR